MNDELKRVLFGSGADDEVSKWELLPVHVACSGNALAVLREVREALVVILSAHLICDSKESWESVTTLELLEERFKRHFELEDPELYPLEGFSQAGRDWLWYDAKVVADDELVIYLSLAGFPVSGLRL